MFGSSGGAVFGGKGHARALVSVAGEADHHRFLIGSEDLRNANEVMRPRPTSDRKEQFLPSPLDRRPAPTALRFL